MLLLMMLIKAILIYAASHIFQNGVPPLLLYFHIRASRYFAPEYLCMFLQTCLNNANEMQMHFGEDEREPGDDNVTLHFNFYNETDPSNPQPTDPWFDVITASN